MGIGREQFSQGLQQGRSGVSRITRFDASDLPSQLAAEVKDFDPAQFLSPKKIRQMDRCTQFAVAAALQAVADAEIVLEKLDRERVGVLIGTAVGGLRWAFEQQRAQQAGGYKTMDPYSIIATYPNAVSGQVAVELGLKGRSDTISSGCASAGTAFGIAAEMIQRGELDLMVVGGRNRRSTRRSSGPCVRPGHYRHSMMSRCVLRDRLMPSETGRCWKKAPGS